MSELSIFEKSQEIRFETEIYANTCERVANVLDDLNDTKANKTDVSAAIQDVIDELTLVEQEIYGYIDSGAVTQNTEIDKKLNKPTWNGYEQQYIVVSTAGAPTHLRPITLSVNAVPFWTGNTFYSSPISVDSNNLRIGINKVTPTEALDVGGYVLANAFRFNVTSSNSAPNKIWTDGTDLYHTNAAGVNNKVTFLDAYKTVIKSNEVLTLDRATLTTLDRLISSTSPPNISLANDALIDKVNEYIVILKCSTTVPAAASIVYPAGVIWRGGRPPQYAVNAITTIVFEKVWIDSVWYILGISITANPT